MYQKKARAAWVQAFVVKEQEMRPYFTRFSNNYLFKPSDFSKWLTQ